jgi:hypothetical protein
MRRVLLALILFTQSVSTSFGQGGSTYYLGTDILENEYVHAIDLPQFQSQFGQIPVFPEHDAVCIRLQFHDPASMLPTPPKVLRVEYTSAKQRDPHFCGLEKNYTRRVLIELKSPPPVTPFVDDAVKLDRKHNRVLFENDRVRIVRVTFGRGQSGPMVDKRPRVIILLMDMHAQVVKPGGVPEARDAAAGTIQWSLGGRQATTNGKAGPLDNIIVELKGK